MHEAPFRIVAATYLPLRRGEKIFLMNRRNTGYADGQYGMIAGHKEEGETIKQAMIREAGEEAGIAIRPENLRMMHVMHRLQPWLMEDGSTWLEERLDFFFHADAWKGEPRNMEPDKCDHIGWFHKDDLPQLLVPYLRTVLDHIHAGIPYSNYGWNGEPSIWTAEEVQKALRIAV